VVGISEIREIRLNSFLMGEVTGTQVVVGYEGETQFY
jgi:hypothetical protein